MVWWFDGLMVWWCDGLMVWWFDGLMIWWFDGLMVWWFDDLMVWWFDGLMVWWFDDLMMRWFDGLMVWWFDGLMLRWRILKFQFQCGRFNHWLWLTSSLRMAPKVFFRSLFNCSWNDYFAKRPITSWDTPVKLNPPSWNKFCMVTYLVWSLNRLIT